MGDGRGASLLHWACGTGNEAGAHALAAGATAAGGGARRAAAVCARATKDGATPLHWAACGVAPQDFGCGGSAPLCSWLLDEGAALDAATDDGNTPLMWAAWSGSQAAL